MLVLPGAEAEWWRAHPGGTDPGSMQVPLRPPPPGSSRLCEPLCATPRQHDGSGCGDHAGGRPCAAAVQPGEALGEAGSPRIARTSTSHRRLTCWNARPAEQKLLWQQGGGVPAPAGRVPAAERGCVRRWVDWAGRCGQCVVSCSTGAAAAQARADAALRFVSCVAAAVAEIKSLGPDRWNDTYYPTAADAANVHKQWCVGAPSLPWPRVLALLLCRWLSQPLLVPSSTSVQRA